MRRARWPAQGGCVAAHFATFDDVTSLLSTRARTTAARDALVATMGVLVAAGIVFRKARCGKLH